MAWFAASMLASSSVCLLPSENGKTQKKEFIDYKTTRVE